MRLQTTLRASKDIHTVKGGYYFKTQDNLLYWFPDTGSKRLLSIYCNPSDWAKIKQER